MKLQTFQEDKEEKTVIDKILRVLIIGLLAILVVLMIDVCGVITQDYYQRYGYYADSWILKPISDWFEFDKEEENAGLGNI